MMDGASRPRTVRAFALSPLAAPVTCAVALVADTLVRAMVGATSMPSARSVLDLLLAVGTIGVPLAYGAALVGGVPLFFILRRLALVTRWTLWIGAAIIGAALAFVIESQLRGDLFSIPFPWWVGAAIGIVTAEVFWRLLAMPNDQ